MGWFPGNGSTKKPISNSDLIELNLHPRSEPKYPEKEILHALALESNIPAVQDAVKNLHVLTKLYHTEELNDIKSNDDSMYISLRRRAKILLSRKA